MLFVEDFLSEEASPPTRTKELARLVLDSAPAAPSEADNIDRFRRSTKYHEEIDETFSG